MQQKESTWCSALRQGGPRRCGAPSLTRPADVSWQSRRCELRAATCINISFIETALFMSFGEYVQIQLGGGGSWQATWLCGKSCSSTHRLISQLFRVLQRP